MPIICLIECSFDKCVTELITIGDNINKYFFSTSNSLNYKKEFLTYTPNYDAVRI